MADENSSNNKPRSKLKGNDLSKKIKGFKYFNYVNYDLQKAGGQEHSYYKHQDCIESHNMICAYTYKRW